jgi:hypothetical protein
MVVDKMVIDECPLHLIWDENIAKQKELSQVTTGPFGSCPLKQLNLQFIINKEPKKF